MKGPTHEGKPADNGEFAAPTSNQQSRPAMESSPGLNCLWARVNVEVVGYLDPTTSIVYANALHRSVFKQIPKQGRISHSALLRGISYKANAMQVKQVLADLLRASLISKTVRGGAQYYTALRNEFADDTLTPQKPTAQVGSEESALQNTVPVPVGEISKGYWMYRNLCVQVRIRGKPAPDEVELRVKAAVLSALQKRIQELDDLKLRVEQMEGGNSSRPGLEDNPPALRRGLWSPIRQRWLDETPEELVRQSFVIRLVRDYGYSVKQMKEELSVGAQGSGGARADIVVWDTVQHMGEGANPALVVECKAGRGTIREQDYAQGENYARLTGAKFLVVVNSNSTRSWEVLHDKMPKALRPVDSIPKAGTSTAEPPAAAPQE